MPAKRELESGLLDQPAMCTTVNSLHTGILETNRVTHKGWTIMST